MRRSRVLAFMTSAALLLTLLLTLGAAPVGAAKITCTYIAPPGGVLHLDFVSGGLPAGEVACGGPGDDFVSRLSGGTFYGNGGNDLVIDINSGIFHGGGGNDVVGNDILSSGVFYGEGGDDFAYYMAGPTAAFFGAGGSDCLRILNQGAYDGGGGTDVVGYYNVDPNYATLKSVEQTGVSCH